MKNIKYLLSCLLLILCATTLTACFGEKDTYEIRISSTITNGTIEANYTEAANGKTITLVISPVTGYQLKEGSLKYNNTVISGTSFTMPAENVIITGEFELSTPAPLTIDSFKGLYKISEFYIDDIPSTEFIPVIIAIHGDGSIIWNPTGVENFESGTSVVSDNNLVITSNEVIKTFTLSGTSLTASDTIDNTTYKYSFTKISSNEIISASSITGTYTATSYKINGVPEDLMYAGGNLIISSNGTLLWDVQGQGSYLNGIYTILNNYIIISVGSDVKIFKISGNTLELLDPQNYYEAIMTKQA